VLQEGGVTAPPPSAGGSNYLGNRRDCVAPTLVSHRRAQVIALMRAFIWKLLYGMTGKSVFFSVNSNVSNVFDCSDASCIVQLPPVETNDIAPFFCGTESVEADIGMGGNCDDSPAWGVF
jgi:hypothetical protein